MLITNTIHHLKVCFRKNTPKVKETHYKELTHDFQNDLYNERLLNEDEYIYKMSISASVGGFW